MKYLITACRYCKKMPVVLLMMIFPVTGFAGNEVRITEDLPYVEVQHKGKVVRIERDQDTTHKLTNSFAKTSRPCPPFCIHPIAISDKIKTVGELELLDFLQTEVKSGKGLLVDARMPEWFETGTIPGSVNIPFTVLSKGIDNKHTLKIIKLLGAKDKDGKLDFSDMKKLLLFCNGVWCNQSSMAINNLVSLGYPEEDLLWYRGGMQSWQLLGLTTVTP